MEIEVPELISLNSTTVSRQIRLDSCTSQQEIKDYLQAVKLGLEIKELSGKKSEGKAI